MMKARYILYCACLCLLDTSCSSFNQLVKSPDTDLKYEAVKQYFFLGKNSNANLLVSDVMPALKGTDKGDEAAFVTSMIQFQSKDYITANDYFKKYYTNYPTGLHVDEARFYAANSLYQSTPQTELDQTGTLNAITEMQNYIEIAPESKFVPQAKDMIFEMQDKLVEKQYQAARLYFNLGAYIGNCTMGGNNYEACIITAENAIKDYPYSKKKEEFSFLILKAKYSLAQQSVSQKMKERLENTIDEYYGFVNEYPDSKHMKEAKSIFEKAQHAYKSIN